MKRSWLLFIWMSSCLLAIGLADAATMVPITACADCHGTNPQATAPSNIPVEGAQRNNPEGSIIGSHDFHMRNTTANTCAACHVMPTALNHRNGKINMAASMAGGVTYYIGGTPASVVTQDNQLTTTGLGTCSGTSCHSSGASPVWGTSSTCRTCHGYPPVTTVGDPDNIHPALVTGPVNHIGTGPTVNTKDSFMSQHGGCQICHGTQSATDGNGNTHMPAAGYTVATMHANSRITMSGPVGTGAGYDPITRGCTAACHANDAGHRMTASGMPVDFFSGPIQDCVSCHTIAQPSPIATALNAAVTSRVAVAPDFSLASRHIRSRTASPAVTKFDCCVCHMEGDVATGSATSFHKDGRVNLRDPDTGLNIKGVTHSGSTTAAGAYTSTAVDATPVRFSRNLGSATIEPDTAAIMINQCLKCHDANGASNAAARRTGATAGQPFGAAIAANPSSNVLDVAGQFASTNRSFHPVLVRQNSGYTNTGGSKMVAPWNGVTKTATTTTYGPLISCWDCHAAPGTASTVTLTSSGIHGGAVSGSVVPLRGSVYVSGTTPATNLCLYCHVVNTGTTNHGTGSAFTSGTDSGMTYFQNRCYFCHASDVSRTRPWGAGDAHGFNARGGVAGNNQAFPAASNGYAFIRSEGWYGNSYQQSIRSVGATTYTPTCNGRGTAGGGAGACSRSSMGGYTPGGVY